ncbi:MAG: cobalamin biosynthesis protein CobD [Gammaproteobacteria bacterium]|nr:cobalamin biosynthesis protein CobD [Gammaproteobacteria bacterium]
MVAVSLGIAALALLIEALAGYPRALLDRLGHPVMWLGALLQQLERRWNLTKYSPRQRRHRGRAALLVLLAATLLVTLPLTLLLRALGPAGWLLEALLASTLLASRSLYEHVLAVETALQTEGLPAGRGALAMIVGRDTAELSVEEVRRAAIESLAENLSDGVIAPLLFACLLGLPGIALYKAVNTADSMIGHRNARYLDFGRSAARLDDLLNLVPARLTALLLACALPSRLPAALKCAWQFAALHRSPNAGWPEAAMAGALGLRLSGPRRYGGALHAEPFVNPHGREAGAADLRQALRLMVRSCVLAGAVVLGCVLLLLAAYR